ncbi:kynurenine 3-monooxygenase-like [Physella acuta]|uniref:kynurenine 3-monooxygenase-like n=1 Tax=Physella acuta TaxID=109671 RepID=UPI0027DBBFF7|nr:kynurenine 3-monooxygenase-like [Physella acuta]
MQARGTGEIRTAEDMSEQTFKVIIVGAGLVGCVEAIYMARKGVKVKIFEQFEDPRTWSEERARSINLTMSPRGQLALREIGLEGEVLKDGVLARGRIVHDGKGNKKHSPYNEKGEGIVSLRRTQLNSLLINAALRHEGVEIFFQHELTSCDVNKGRCTFKVTSGGQVQELECGADLIIGADGAHSAVREQMFKARKLDFFKQEYHDDGYMELKVPAGPGQQYQMEPDMLHIWPRGEFMLITFPNLDGTFSGTLFMPFKKFDEVMSDKTVMLDFFNKEFPDLVRMVGEKNLIHHFFEREDRRPGRLVSNQVKPYHAGEKVLIMGDAAHAMVPFYGQGMNSGFEDCLILDEIFTRHGFNKEKIGRVLKDFSAARCDDGHAISEMAHAHYKELRSDIAGPVFYLRKFLDNMLYRVFPNNWVPEYTMVAFTNTSYSKCRQETARQKFIINMTLGFFSFCAVLIALACKAWLWP